MSSSNSKNPKGESHRIYWQQWLQDSNSTNTLRDLITSSAAIRISPTGARAKDVTDLLRDSLNISPSSVDETEGRDRLVLVGTLFSLPEVQFEHEQFTESELEKKKKNGKTSEDGEASVHAGYAAHTLRSDPFHVVRTLSPDENPLIVKDQLMDHLRELQQGAPASRTIISPKIQWYFVPSTSDTTSCIPNCIDLDGYCTSMEEEDSDDCEHDDDDDTDGDDDGHGDLADLNADPQELSAEMQSAFPWLRPSTETSHPQSHLDQHEAERLKREDYRSYELAKTQSSVGNNCMSGYLLKRSSKDPHVWKRVHCVLTDDYLWYVSRLYKKGDTTFARHGRIRLRRALLLEPAADYLPLYRTPYAFEVVSEKGTSHIFRCKSKQLQRQWIKALSERIVQSYENGHLDHAELIIADECLARSRRIGKIAAEPLWEECAKHDVLNHTDGGRIGAISRLGLEVSDYRENCRYVNSVLPAKNPVVVTGERKVVVAPEPVDPAVQDMIRACWDQAAALLARATHVGLQLQPKLSNSVETLCRHVDYVITGRFRSLTENGDFVSQDQAHNGNGANDRQSPPPVDLFDHLLTELQIHAAAAVASPLDLKGSENDDTATSELT